MTDVLLSIRNLCVDYLTDAGVARAVDDISFDIRAGEVFGLAGESGCGKSTTAFAIARLIRMPGFVSDGEVLFEGEDVLRMDAKRLRAFRWAQTSVVLQSAMNALNPVIRVSEQVCDAIRAHQRVNEDQARSRTRELFALVGIDPGRLDDYPHQFSGGMRQRICIAMALALRPRLIIMDEPTTALDVVVQRDIIGKISALQREFGFSVLFISHDLGLMLEFCDRIGVMYAGRLVEAGTARQVGEQPAHPYTQALLRSFPSLCGPRRRLQGIPGAPPRLTESIAGCAFAPRCEKAESTCLTQTQALASLTEGRVVACARVSRPLVATTQTAEVS
ncbi:ABC transporter ATP-binding protein [Hahella sp. HN01]|uniref:ABC transporter ATP-binding protein n=1 Tax=Hahella sp. HN01 TaxID=2847262 RepID=UPI001C1EC0EA|nr:ABC transporter ATP-binding protein [Hahella sp. HN01]MBU6951658.1 ABC transporter ATP-binding protein [Hahella sp. HN01]